MYVVGTAGHVDHGKSTLVEALTGINPDRLKEERERQMTIDLGFAWLTLPGGIAVGVVDVPGHRDFIENMLAGVGGIDAALLVIAADEGVMPQTREHLAILNLLHISTGVVALTKSDLVEAEWLDLIRADVAALLRGTALEAAPLIPVSARTGQGLDALRAKLVEVLAGRPTRPDLGRPHLPIDRVFSMAGFGTVVTGTLSGGSLRVGDEVVMEPGGLGARVRGLQTHKAKRERALPGSRVAVNLVGVDVGDLRRGQVVALPGTAQPTTLIDVRLDHLAGASQALKHNDEVKLFVGAAEVVARARLLEAELLPPGASGWAQLALRGPVVAVKGERFILRRPSPAETIAGGTVVDPHPARAHRRSQASVLARLETLARGTPAERMLQALDSLGPAAPDEASQQTGLDLAEGAAAIEELVSTGLAVRLEGGALLVSAAALNAFIEALREVLGAYHRAQPLRGGMPREAVRSRLGAGLPPARHARWTARVFNALLAEAITAGVAVAAGPTVRLSEHQIVFAPAAQTRVDALLTAFRRDPHNPPSHKECAAQVGDDVLAALIEQGVLVALSAEVVFLAETYAALVAAVRAHLAAHGSLTVAEARDLFGSSRKYMLALLEHLDAAGVTRRDGDARVARQSL